MDDKFSVDIIDLAQLDAADARDYYNSKVPNLGKRFIQQLGATTKTLSINPYFEVKYKNVRTILMNQFPYLVHFIVDERERTVLVIAIVYAGMKPINYKSRLK